MGQRLRFYSEQAVWIIPNLFVRSSTMKNQKFVKTLYGEDYKHGWRVSLDDKTFNKYYHIITGYKHISNNYNRELVSAKKMGGVDDQCGLRDHLQECVSGKQRVIWLQNVEDQKHDSDSILGDILDEQNRIDADNSNIASLMISHGANMRNLKFSIYRFENIECKSSAVRDIDDCEYIDTVIQNLQKFQECDFEIDALSVIDFNLESIINAFDHLVRVHNFLSDDIKKLMIQNHISEQVKCPHGADCDVLSKHSNRTRERQSIEEKTDEQLDEIDSLCEPIAEALDSLHCYTLHRKEHLYRLLSGDNNEFQSRFATDAAIHDTDQKDDEKEDAPIGINFGVNVLQWLVHNASAIHDNLRDEITRNPKSTIDRALYTHFEMLCIAKVKGTNYTLKEMMCLKLYSDTTELQALLRRAHWTNAPAKVRKAYYNWAMGLYQTHLYHAVPIPAASGKNKPCKLYHGLSQMFMMSQELPIYNGPFSTTIARSVDTTFCKEQGLIWMIQSTFVNPLRFCIGISMDWISGFKHEHEVLLYNQYLPIQKTETFDDDTSVLIDHLLYSLLNRDSAINDPDDFFTQLGIRFDVNWIQDIAKHTVFWNESKYNGMRVIDRLYTELNMAFFKIFQWINNLVVDKDEKHIILDDVEKFTDDNISDLVFTGSFENGIVTDDEPCRFEKVSQLAIPCQKNTVVNSKSLRFNIYCKSVDDSFDFVKVNSLTLPQNVFGGVIVSESVDVPKWNEKLGRGGILKVRSFSDFVVESKVAIRCDAAAVNGNGGDLRIIAGALFKNDGIVCCNGGKRSDGGAIYIVADSFVNNGLIASVPNGEIHIFCREYINSGEVSSEPTVTITEQHSNVTNDTQNGVLPLSVIDYLFLHLDVEWKDAEDVHKTLGVRVDSSWCHQLAVHSMFFENAKDVVGDDGQDGAEHARFEESQDSCESSDSLTFETSSSMAEQNSNQSDDGQDGAKSKCYFEVLARILKFPFLRFLKIIYHAMVSDAEREDQNILLQFDEDDEEDKQIAQNMISDYEFMIRFGDDDQSESKPYRFEDISLFSIPWPPLFGQTDIAPVHVFMRRLDSGFVKVKSLLKHFYAFQREDVLTLSQSIDMMENGRLGQDRILRIQCSTKIVVDREVNIRASGVMLISPNTITNKGRIYGHDDDIFVAADTFVNEGVLDCGENGNIAILCGKFTNYESITPTPTIVMESMSVLNILCQKWWKLFKILDEWMQSNDNRKLYVAVKHQEPKLVDLLIRKYHVHVNRANRKGQTPLWIAAREGHVECAKVLIQHGADVDKTKTKNRTTPLNIACTNGRKAVAELLISSGADVDETDSDGKPALAAAVDNGHSEIVAMLLEHENVNADELADEFLTALLLVAAGMEALEEMFDNMENEDTIPDMKIDNELQSRHAECIKLLIQHGADVNTVEKETGFTPVIVAAAVGYAEIVKLLLRAGADVMKTVEANGVNCIHFAATFGKLESIKVIYEYLVNNKDPEQVSELMNGRDNEGMTPLHWACNLGHEDVGKYLVNEIKVDVSKKDNDGNTALIYAKDGEHESIVALLSRI